jgi:RNA polymerase sigma factor (sigma-70 family)
MNTVHQLVEDHILFVDKIASRKKASLPKRISLEELKSAGYLGLVESANRYEPAKGSFTTFAYPRILGAIIDYLRECQSPCSKEGYMLSLDSCEDDGCSLAETISSPDKSQTEEIFEEITSGMDDKAQLVLRCYLIDELSMKEVGRKIGVTESRVSQLIAGYKENILSRWTFKELAA